MAYLNKEDWIHSVPGTIGEQVKIHHCKQGNGNAKLYIKRVENGAIAYCHHCGERGFIGNCALENGTVQIGRYVPKSASGFVSSNTGDDGTGDAGRATGEANKTPVVCYPKDSVNSVKHWSNVNAKVWILKYGIPMDDINAAGICWSDSLSSILFPRYFQGNLVAFQARKFPESKPKYMTYGDSKSLYDPLGASPGRSRLVLVEDYVSALKVSEIAPALPLGGVAIKDDHLSYLLNKYDTFDIMLDNDNSQVKRNQVKLLNKLSGFTRNVRIIPVTKDPKEYSSKELEELLK
jgi:hypothetical protein